MQASAVSVLPVGENAKQEHGPDAQVNHDIGGIEDVIPEGDVLYIDEVDDAAIDESVGDITGTAAYYEAEADVFIALQVLAEPEIGADPQKQADTDHAEQPARPLCQPEYTAEIADVGEMHEAADFECRILGNIIVHPVTNRLGKQQHSYRNREIAEHIDGFVVHCLEGFSIRPGGDGRRLLDSISQRAFRPWND